MRGGWLELETTCWLNGHIIKSILSLRFYFSPLFCIGRNALLRLSTIKISFPESSQRCPAEKWFVWAIVKIIVWVLVHNRSGPNQASEWKFLKNFFSNEWIFGQILICLYYNTKFCGNTPFSASFDGKFLWVLDEIYEGHWRREYRSTDTSWLITQKEKAIIQDGCH